MYFTPDYSVIKNIAETEIEKVKNDRRIAFCLLEHSKIMRGRIEFLFKHDYLQQNDYKVLKEQIDDVVHGASVLQGMVIKNRLVKVEDDRFKRCLFDIYQGERRLVCNLLKRM